MPIQPLAVILQHREGYYKQKQFEAAVRSSASSFPAPVQKSRGAALD